MTPVSLENIKQAGNNISHLVPPTPLLNSIFLSQKYLGNIFLKLENLNISGSFKIRGAANAILSADKGLLKKGVVAASAGNHAQGVAEICRRLNVKATIFMPVSTPLIKVESTKALGAEVILTGKIYDDAYQQALQYQKKYHGFLIHAFKDINVINGQGTIGLELLDQMPEIGTIIVPIGGGGLISGIACAVKETNPKIKVVGVQSKTYSAMKQSIDQGKVVVLKPGPTIADGIAVKNIEEINFRLIQQYVDDIVVVDDDMIASAIMELMERNHLLAEGAGAASVAGLSQITIKSKALPVICIISGGNIDVNLLKRIADKGLIYSGRLMRIRFTVDDSPGQLAHILSFLSQLGANVLEVQHNRMFGTSHYREVEIEIDLETINSQQQQQIAESLKANDIKFDVLNGKFI